MNKLRELRKKNKISAEKLAEMLNITVRHLYDLEAGKVQLAEERIKYLCENFNVTSDYLLGRTDDPSPRKDVRDVLTPEVLRDHGVEYAEVSDYLKKNGITDKEAVEMLKEIDEFRKRMNAKYVEKS